MARAPAPAAAPMPAADPMMGGGAAAPMDPAMAPAEAEGEGMPTVLCTVLMNPDGSLQLVEGDENEAIHGGEEMAEGEGEGAAQEGQTFDSVGPLLKAVLDIVQTAMDGGESGADQMRAGYAGDEGAAPAA